MLGNKYANGTIRLCEDHLRRAYNLAVQDGVLERRYVPFFGARLEATPPREIFIDPIDFWPLHAALLEICAEFAEAVEFAYKIGWRRSEVLKLQWSEIIETTRISHGHTEPAVLVRLPSKRSKNRKAREIELAGGILEIIDQRRRERVDDCPYVFHRHGKRMVGQTWWQRGCDAIGRSDLHFHDMRRSASRNMIRSGTEQTVAMKVSGHLTDQMFRRYNITDGRDTRAALERVDAYVEGAKRAQRRVESVSVRRTHQSA